MTGRNISHYKILEKIGEGGMGVVYKAEDTKLDRTVALKFLAAHLLTDAESRKRFEREAKAAAALSHPNICTIHEIDEAEGRTFLAMEFIEGESLQARIEKAPLPLNEALDLARQTANGLEAAHEAGVVHRDIKPGNLLITPKEQIKILDFGLALLTEGSKLTQLDTTLGTIAYMSPEQTMAAGTDSRTDIWALGVVLYETVSGRLPFRGDYDRAVMYSITSEEPEPLTGLRTGVPMELEWLINKCLAKQPDGRYQNAADLIVDLTALSKKMESGQSTIMGTKPVATGTPAGPNPQLTNQSASGEPQPPVPDALDVTPQAPAAVRPGSTFGPYRIIEDLAPGGESAAYRAEDTQLRRSVTISVLPESAARRAEQRQRLKVIGTAVFFALAVALILLSWTRQPASSEPASLRRFAFTPEGFRREATISPNGKHIAYLAGTDQPAIWVRDLDREEPRDLPGTAGARALGLFWSPESQFIGFAAGNELKKISVQGGPVITLCSLPQSRYYGGSWSPDGDVITFSSAFPPRIYEVPSQGGDPKLLFEAEQSEKGYFNVRPRFLPANAAARGIVFAQGSSTDRDILVQNLETGESLALTEGGYPVFSPTGHILYQRDVTRGGLWALPFSIETLKPAGEPFPIAENAQRPTVAMDGTLVSVDALGSGRQRLVWLDRAGRKLGTIGQPQQVIQHPALSPDGERVLVSAFEEGTNEDIWVHEVGRALKTRLTFDPGSDSFPKWSTSGEEVVFGSNRAGNYDIFSRAADGSAEPVSLVSTPRTEVPSAWSPDMKYFLYVAVSPETGPDIWYLERKELEDGFDSRPFLQTAFRETNSRLSPDGRFVAYFSEESGRPEVYVRPFPQGGGKWEVSANGGYSQRWSRDGSELFYVEGETLISVAVSTTDGFSAGSAKPLFKHPGLGRGTSSTFDVSADGQRFVVVEDLESEDGEQARPPSIHIVENWFEEFKDREQD